MDKYNQRSKSSDRSFLITIDTEGDNLWSKPRNVTTRNVSYLHRFQSLCESYGFKPTYLTNHEMAIDPAFQEFAKSVLERRAGEIGMHLHAWNSPPLVPLTGDDFAFQPYLIEYSRDIMREKITVLTDLLESVFATKMVSHRAGRWSFNEIYAQLLIESGYCVDCSVTPHVSWKQCPGDPKRNGGTDYSQFPDKAYFIDSRNISSPGDSPLLEVPMTIISPQKFPVDWLRRNFKSFSFFQRVLNHFFPAICWLRPAQGNRKALLYVVRQAIGEKRGYIQFMLHSSELMPGGSPNFPSDSDIETLYEDLAALFNMVQETFVGATLKDYYQLAKAGESQ